MHSAARVFLVLVIIVASTACGPTPELQTTTPASTQDALLPESEEPASPPPTEVEPTEPPPPPIEVGMERPVLAGKGQPACIEQVRQAYRLMKKSQDSEARPLLEKALSECPRYAPAHYDLAVIHARAEGQPEIEKAVDALEQALRANYLRYATFMQDDEELEPLRKSVHWEEVTKRVEAVRREWVEALARPGAFVLLGHDDPRASVIDNVGTGLPSVKTRADLVSLVRGQLFFRPHRSGKLLPLGQRQVGGFILDGERRQLHLWTWKRTHGWTESVSSSQSQREAVLYGLQSGAAVETIELDSLTSLGRRRVSKALTRERVMLCDDRVVVFSRATVFPEPPREITTTGVTRLGKTQRPDINECEPFQDLHRFRFDSSFRRCEPWAPGELLCELNDVIGDPPRKLVVAADSEETTVVEGPPILQVEATAPVDPPPVDPARVPAPTGLTCETITAPEPVAFRSNNDMYCEVRDISVQGRYAFVASTRCGVLVWDVENPAAPQKVAQLHHEANVYTVHVKGRHLLVGDGVGLRTFDVSNPVLERGFPGSPRRVNTLGVDSEFHGRDVVILGDTAYVASKGHGVHVVDVSDRLRPRYLSKVKGAGFAERLFLEGERLIVQATTYHRLESDRVLDLANPRSPRVVKLGGRRPHRPEYRSDHYRLVASSKGLVVHDLRQTTKSKVARVPLKGSPSAIAVEGRHAYVVSNPTWLQVIRLCSP